MTTLKNGVARALICLALAGPTLFPTSGITAVPEHASYIVYVGGYTALSGKGIYAYRLTPSGKVTPMGLIEAAVNPSWLADDLTHRFLYTVNEHPAKDAPDSGNSITAYGRDGKTGKLTLLNRVSSNGIGPEQLVIDPKGKIVAAAHFGTGNVATFRILSDGRLSEAIASVTEKPGDGQANDQRGPGLSDSHIEGVAISPDGRYVLTCNIGLATVTVYRLNAASGALEQAGEPFTAAGPPGQRWRPRHLAFDPAGNLVYIMDSSMQVTIAALNAATGTLKQIHSIPVPSGYPVGQLMSALEIRVDRTGRFVYTSARPVDEKLKATHQHGVITVFSVDQKTHKLTPVQQVTSGGESPRSFALDPSGKFLFVANQNSGAVEVLAVDERTGTLSPTGEVLKDVPEPSAFVFEADGREGADAPPK